MNAESLRHSIIIEKLTAGFDEIGNQTEEWSNYHPCRVAINGIGGSEYMAAKAEQAENTLTFEVRYCNALKEINPQEYRISWNGDIYDIQHIDNYKFLNESLKVKAVRHG